jgi:hypothetical protein
MEIMEDRNWLTKERYHNLFELRRMKCRYMLDLVSNDTTNRFFFLRYEDLLHNYENTLDNIQKQFHLHLKYPLLPFVKTPKYKGTFNALYEKKPILLPESVREYIWKNVDVEQEASMGYHLSTP